MKIKMSEVITLANFYETIQNLKMPLKVAYKFSKLNQSLSKEVSFYQEKFNEIIDEFALRDESGNIVFTEDQTSIQIMKGRELECNTKLAELRDLEVELPEITFSLEELESFNFTISEMNCLMPLISE